MRAVCVILSVLVLAPLWTETAARVKLPVLTLGGQAAEQGEHPTFAEWLEELRVEALARGFSADIVERVFQDIESVPTVLESDRAQVERTLSIESYLRRRVTPAVVRTGQNMARRHGAVLRQVEAVYGVSGRFVMAVWGLESNFGRFSGTRPTIAALATLAYDPRRSGLFRRELFEALTILDRGEVELDRLKGSWAGAMGQPQFLPSSYLKYAVDFDQDGRRDIWATPADVFASIANYLSTHGWIERTIWGREVRIPPTAAATVARAAPQRTQGCEAVRQMSQRLPLARWSALGVTRPGGAALPQADLDASLVRTETRVFLVYSTYEALLAYNCAHTYALSVAMLADRIAGAR